MTLMLTVAPLAWAYTTYLALVAYPGERLLRGAGIIAVVFLTIAVLLDFVFFGLIRQAMEELYHPTTLYGYGFLLFLPFIVAWIMKERINRRKRIAKLSDKVNALSIGAFCLLILVLVITLNIRI